MIKVFVEDLQQAAAVLASFAESPKPGSLRWNGMAYVPVRGEEEFTVDPYAAKWWAILTVVAGMLEGLAEIPAPQKTYLQQLLFGGTGSFEDFALDERLDDGGRAAKANGRLAAIRGSMFDHFRKL